VAAVKTNIENEVTHNATVLYNVFRPTGNRLHLSMHRSHKEHRSTWKNTRIHT